jgi:uncharacterized protein YrrD
MAATTPTSSLLYAYDLVGMPVFDSEDEAGLFLGYVLRTLINQDRTKVVGFVIRTRIFRPKRAFPFEALKWIEDEFFLVETAKVKWLPRQRELYKVYVEEKQDKPLEAVEGDTVVGKVTDFIFDSSTGEIVKVQIDRGLLSKLINIPRDDIITLSEDAAVLREGAISEAKKPTRKPAEPLLERLAVKTARGLATVTHRAKQKVKEKLK